VAAPTRRGRHQEGELAKQKSEVAEAKFMNQAALPQRKSTSTSLDSCSDDKPRADRPR
jgi:hypothetical protein